MISVVERVAVGGEPACAPSLAFERVREAGGAAVVITEDRLVTKAHVVPATTREGWASFPDGLELRFSVVGRDPFSDLAVIAIDRSDLPSRSCSAAIGGAIGTPQSLTVVRSGALIELEVRPVEPAAA